MTLAECAEVIEKKIAVGQIAFGVGARYVCAEDFMRTVVTQLRMTQEENKKLRALCDVVEDMPIGLFLLNRLHKRLFGVFRI